MVRYDNTEITLRNWRQIMNGGLKSTLWEGTKRVGYEIFANFVSHLIVFPEDRYDDVVIYAGLTGFALADIKRDLGIYECRAVQTLENIRLPKYRNVRIESK